MDRESLKKDFEDRTAGLEGGSLSRVGLLSRIWDRQISWQVRLRWWVPPAILLCALLADALGFEFRRAPILCIAGWMLLYNAALTLAIVVRHPEGGRRSRRFSMLEVTLDYASMFALIFCTGGPASPLIFFFIFHVIFAAIHFEARVAYVFAGSAAAGLWLLAALEHAGALVSLPLRHAGTAFTVATHPGHVTAMLGFCTASVFIAAASTNNLMRRLRERVNSLVNMSRRIAGLNDRLHRLHTMTTGIGAERSLETILDIVTREFAGALEVEMTSIKLLDEQRRNFRFASACGLPAEVTDRVVPLSDSSPNRRVFEGETLTIGALDGLDDFHLKEPLQAIGVKSIVCAPLRVADRVIGVLSAYSREDERFSNHADRQFINMVAELAALAIDNADAYAEINALLDERSRFTLQVAHNMRSPLGAGLGMLELISSGYMGEVTEKQAEYLTRVSNRLQALNDTVGELMTLAQTRDRNREIVDVRVDIGALAEHLETTFGEEARARGIRLEIVGDPSLPEVDSGADLLRDMMENLVSNGLKYTPAGGSVEVKFLAFDADHLRIVVSDTGIGIPVDEQSELFREFFRARNARQLDEVGTGLGLALVKQTVLRHDGSIFFASEEGEGTRFVIDLPFRRVTSDRADREGHSNDPASEDGERASHQFLHRGRR